MTETHNADETQTPFVNIRQNDFDRTGVQPSVTFLISHYDKLSPNFVWEIVRYPLWSPIMLIICKV